MMQGISLIVIVEDVLSEAVVKKMFLATGRDFYVPSTLKFNKDEIKNKINGFNKSAKGHPYFVLTDQDTANRCPPNAIRELPTAIHPNLLYRFAVMEVEAWVMADKKRVCQFLVHSLEQNPNRPGL